MTDIDINQNPALTALQNLRMRLLDLTARNRLLNFRHTKSASLRVIDELPDQLTELLLAEKEMRFLPISEPTKDELIEAGYIEVDLETGQEHRLRKDPSAEEWARRLGLSTEYEVPKLTDKTEASNKHSDDAIQTLFFPYELETRLRNLHQKSKTAIEESGANILFLAFGFLEWFESNDSEKSRISPLYLVPAQLHKGKLNRVAGTYEYTLTYSGEEILPNLSLREKLRNDFGLALPDLDEDTKPEVYFEKVVALIDENQPRWNVRRYVTLSLLNFSKLLMYLDLDPDRWPEKAITEHPIVERFLAGVHKEGEEEEGVGYIGFGEEYVIDDIPDIHEKYPLIADADSSQHSALIDAVDGKNLVIEGPPGTGKSQTITNLIAALMVRGKKVLFVAEKLAALEVVKRRLDEAGLGDFCLELHSHKSQKRKVLDEIEARLKNSGRCRKPKDIEADIERLESLKDDLRRHVEIINRPWKNTGKTIHKILMAATRYREALKIDPGSLHPKEFDSMKFDSAMQRVSRDQVLAYGEVYKAVSQYIDGNSDLQGHPWFGVKNGDLQLFDTDKVCAELEHWQQSLQVLSDMRPSIAETLSCDINDIPEDVDGLEAISVGLLQIPKLHGDELLDVLPKLKEEALEKFGGWLNLFKGIQSLFEQLSKLVSREILNDLELVDGLLKGGNQLRTLAGDNIELGKLADSVQRIESLESQLREFQVTLNEIAISLGDNASNLLQSHEDGLKEFKVLVGLVAALKPEYWRYRGECFENDELDQQLLPILKKRVESLRQDKAALSEKFNIERLPQLKDLEDIRRLLADTSVFRWLKGEWRSARKNLLSCAKNKKPKFADLFPLLDSLIEFVQDNKKFDEDEVIKELLGENFKGLETDVDMLVEIREWYKSVRQAYGVGFGPKVSFGDAVIGMPVNLGRAIRSLVERDISKQIDSFTDELSELKIVFGSVNELQAGNVDLIGQDGVFEHLKKELHVALEPCQSFMQDSSISLGEMSKRISKLITLRQAVNKWQKADIDNNIFNGRLGLKTGLGVDNRVGFNAARHTENLAKAVDEKIEKPIIKERIYNKPESGVLESLLIIGNKLKEALESQATSKSGYSELVRMDAAGWMIQCGEKLEDLIRRNIKALENRELLVNWLDYIRIREHLSLIGFDCIAASIEKQALSIENLEAGYLAGVYDILAREVLHEVPEVARFSGHNQEALRNQFKNYDELLQGLQSEMIAWQIDQNRVPRGTSGGKVSAYTEHSLLEHECGKKTRHIPIRQLVKRAGNALIALKPCFMMGPMSVAQYLAPGLAEFDVVVMDEASQIKPEDALGAIARSDQLVVVGDPKQLPPTSFFEKVLNDEEDTDSTAIEESESILDATLPMFAARRLRWHYRSQHESLIAFSNYSFYGGDLVLFPSPNSESDDYGVKFSRVRRGRFINRRNIEEARVIAEAVREHFLLRSEETLGVVAMSADQREQIERSVEALAKENADFQAYLDKNQLLQESLFIKNLENVQGDERDVIFISMTYGPQEAGGRRQGNAAVRSD